MTHWITADWPAPAYIKTATTLRTGGVSAGRFASLNPAQHVGDSSPAVLANRQAIKAMLDLPSEPMWLQQTHGNQVVAAHTMLSDANADASYTDVDNIVCAVMTADCLPVLLCDTEGTTVAAIHGGWRGLLNGIIQNTLANMPTTELLAWLGPAIGPHCFEVGPDVRHAFVIQSEQFACAFIAKGQDKYWADIYQIAHIILNNAGVRHIYGGNYCTVTQQEQFFSYRRDGQTGRMVTLIWKQV
jgi:YfiH family protein